MTDARPKRVRSCVSCGTKDDKVHLHRIVRTGAGDVAFDPTGRVPGRGAYVCSSECLSRAFAQGKVQRALKANISSDDAKRIEEQLASAVNSASNR